MGVAERQNRRRTRRRRLKVDDMGCERWQDSRWVARLARCFMSMEETAHKLKKHNVACQAELTHWENRPKPTYYLPHRIQFPVYGRG